MELKRGGETQLVVFTLKGEEFACDIAGVREVLKVAQITPVPKSLDFVEGVINLRGEVIPVLDLRRRLCLPGAELTEQSRTLVIDFHSRPVGLIVDSVTGVIRLPHSQIQETPDQVAGNKTHLICGVGKAGDRLLIILNLERILSSEEQIVLEDILSAAREAVAGA